MTDAASFPTPNPRPGADGIDEVSARAFGEVFQALVNVGADRQSAERYAFAAQLALDLPARDARIRAEVAEEIAAHLDRLAVATTSPTARRAWRCASEVAREHAGKGFQGNAAGSAVPAEGSGHRCPSRIAHESGAVHRCDLLAGHDGMHEVRLTGFFAEGTAGGSGHPQPATRHVLSRNGRMSVRCVDAEDGCEDTAQTCACSCHVEPPEVGRLPWPHGADPVTGAWLRSQGLNPEEVAAQVREHIDTLIRRTGGDDRG